MKFKEVEEKKLTTFGRLGMGATFMQNGNLYLKLDSDYAPDRYDGAAVDLGDGEIGGFDNEEAVSHKECEILVHPLE